MGTTAHAIAVGGSTHWLDLVSARIDQLESRWTRFRDDSDLARINSAHGGATVVSPETAWLLARALDASERTRGLFDPTVLPALVAAGYDRSWELIERPAVNVELGVRPPGCRGIRVDADRLTVTAPADVRIDLGGIGKGAAADLVADELGSMVDGGCINIGGDLRVWGTAPEGYDSWPIAVEVPGHDDLVVAVSNGALATSTTTRRCWPVGDGVAHHLIDPRTGRPAASDLVSVTVAAPTATDAEVLAKSTLIAGVGAALDASDGCAALLMRIDGVCLAINGFEELCR